MFDRFKRKRKGAAADPTAAAAVDAEKEQQQGVGLTGDPSGKEKAAAQTPTAPDSVADTEGGAQQPDDLQKKLSLHEGDIDESNIVYPPLLKVLPIVTGLYLSIFLVALDQTIIATAIPKITDA